MWFALGRAAAVCVLVVLGSAQAAVAATPKPAASDAPHTKDAPLDAYFGPFKISPLSIRSTIGFLGRQYHQRQISDHDLLHKAVIVQDALNDWRKQYPHDGWMVPTYFHLYELFEAVQTAEARKLATDVANDVIRMYPTTHEAHLCRLRLAQGFPPLQPESPLAIDSPAPGGGTPAASETAAPGAAPDPSASPASRAPSPPAAAPSPAPS